MIKFHGQIPIFMFMKENYPQGRHCEKNPAMLTFPASETTEDTPPFQSIFFLIFLFQLQKLALFSTGLDCYFLDPLKTCQDNVDYPDHP